MQLQLNQRYRNLIRDWYVKLSFRKRLLSEVICEKSGLFKNTFIKFLRLQYYVSGHSVIRYRYNKSCDLNVKSNFRIDSCSQTLKKHLVYVSISRTLPPIKIYSYFWQTLISLHTYIHTYVTGNEKCLN